MAVNNNNVDSSSGDTTPVQEKAALYHIENVQTNDNALTEKGVADLQAAIDPVKEKALVRKIDRHVIPMVMSLYLMSFIDRYDNPSSRGV
jgi:hypothetical protein